MKISNNVFSAGEYKKKHASFTVLAFVVSPRGPHGFVRGATLFFSPGFPFVSLAGSFSSRPTAPTVFAGLTVDNKRYTRHTDSRNIKYIALLRRLRWDRGGGGPEEARSPGPPRPGGEEEEEDEASSRRKGRLAGTGDGGGPPAVDEFIEEKLGGL